MSDIKLVYSGQTPDLDLSGHRLNLASGQDATWQHLKIRLQFFLGEHFLDTRLGIPFYREVLTKNPNLRLVRSMFKDAIEDTPGIATVDDMQLDIDAGRTLTITFSATTDTGEALIYEPFIITL